MRGYPWHLRLPTTEHFQWFKNLVKLHELTTSWIRELQMDRPSFELPRGLKPEISENLWMLESLFEIELEQLLDDTSPSDTLSRLEHTIWAVQSCTLTYLTTRNSPPSLKTSLDCQLEQASWKTGRECGETRWKGLTLGGSQDLRDILLALNDSPFAGYPKGDGFLVKRAISTEVQIELRACPHQIHYPEIIGVSNRLCRLHAHWMRGFAYALNNRVSVEHVVQTPRCTQHWFFP